MGNVASSMIMEYSSQICMDVIMNSTMEIRTIKEIINKNYRN